MTTAQSKTAADIMNPHVHALREDESIERATRWLQSHGYAGAPVLSREGALVGILSEYDCIRALVELHKDGLPAASVANYMSRQLRTVEGTAPLLELASQFSQGQVRRLLVVDQHGGLAGIVTRKELVAALLKLTAGSEPAVATYDVLRKAWR